MPTYKENVRAIAEEMRQDVTPGRPLSAGDYRRAIIAVRHMASAVKKALTDDNMRGAYISDYLLENGLVPDQEAGKDE